MSLQKRLEAVEVELSIKKSPQEQARKRVLQQRIAEARARCGMKPRPLGPRLASAIGRDIANMVKAARLDRQEAQAARKSQESERLRG